MRWAALLLLALAACSKNEPAAEAAAPAATSENRTAASPPPAPAVSAEVRAMGTDDLRAAATKALGENRIYAPGGDNAVEYYLALRDKLPDDPGVTSALTDLMPYTLIAAEQSIGREDFAEAQRLSALIEKADVNAPALPRLKQTIANAQKAAEARGVTEAAQTELAAQADLLEQQRVAQQAEQQRAAAEALVAQERRAAAREAEAQRTAAAQRAASQREAAARAAAATPPAPVAATPAAVAAATADTTGTATAPVLRVVSAPPPRYPAEALRAGTSGEVVVEITVGPDGSVTNARVVRATPSRVFDREALNAVRRWRFEPIDSATTTRRTIAFNPG